MNRATYPLPSPISVNSIYRNVYGMGRVKTARYRTWEQAAGWALKSAGPIVKISGPVWLTFRIPRPRSTMDIDNCLKAYIDLLMSLGAIDDDRNVTGLFAEWSPDKVGEVVITEGEKL